MPYSPSAFFSYMRAMRDREQRLIETSPHLAKAMAAEKMEGHRLAVIARTGAFLIIMAFLPTVILDWSVLYYEAILVLLIVLGWWQYRAAQVGYSKYELLLIFADIVLLTLIFITPNPFQDEVYPSAMIYRFGNFPYFFILLALATLAYSWRTVWAMGTWVTIVWLCGVAAIWLFGRTLPELDAASDALYADYPLMQHVLEPGTLSLGNRFQDVIIFIIVAAILAIKGFRSNQLLLKQAGLAAERANLSRYFPPNLVDALAATGSDVGAVKSQEVAVLFTDIVGFTKFAERNSPEEVMDLLRTYHAMVEKAIFENSGTLEKYIGDGVMATFGRPEPTSTDTKNAVQCALQVMQANRVLNSQREQQGKEAVQISIGIHYGPVILGDIGPERRMEFAVVGDTVNVAARLEAATRNLGCNCVVSDRVIENINSSTATEVSITDTFTSHGSLPLKGRGKPIEVWVS